MFKTYYYTFIAQNENKILTIYCRELLNGRNVKFYFLLKEIKCIDLFKRKEALSVFHKKRIYFKDILNSINLN